MARQEASGGNSSTPSVYNTEETRKQAQTARAVADAYAKDVVMVQLAEGDPGVFRKIRQDFDAKSVGQSDHQIRRRMDELLEQAIKSVKQTG